MVDSLHCRGHHRFRLSWDHDTARHRHNSDESDESEDGDEEYQSALKTSCRHRFHGLLHTLPNENCSAGVVAGVVVVAVAK
jgi:hypothetical protein